MINWLKSQKPKTLYFKDIQVNEKFVIDTGGSKGAVYTKVENVNGYNVDDSDWENEESDHAMMEIATGKLWASTKSPVKLVDVEINIDAEKPSIYD